MNYETVMYQFSFKVQPRKQGAREMKHTKTSITEVVKNRDEIWSACEVTQNEKNKTREP